MAIASGTLLGSYEILAPLGSGGMGEVYRARDRKLGRDVAIKVLPEGFALDPQRLSRFEREARLLASLNHPNVATLHGLEKSGDQPFLVMELVEGETLQEHVAKGPMPADEAVPLFVQIAEGLEAAHEKGVVHRDLKPANVKITPEGKPKILDFGLAKAFAAEEGVSAETSQSPTLTKGTALGVIMGTASYMSPEQARGRTVDRRADVWAFGCCLFEALAGRKAFAGDTVTDILAAVVEREPTWDALPARTPALLCDLLRRCLRKDVKRRLQHVGDARVALEEALTGVSASAAPARKSLRWAWALAAIGVLFGISGWLTRGDRFAASPSPGMTRFDIRLPEGSLAWERVQETAQFDVSRDGRLLVYVAVDGGARRLYLRRMDSIDATALPGTDDALSPFFSPDGKWIGFFTNSELRKIAVDGSAPVSLVDVPPVHRGGSWGANDEILLAPEYSSGIFRVSAAGGGLAPVTEPDRDRKETAHLWPQWLPDGRRFLFTVWRGGSFDEAAIAVGDVQTGEYRILVEGGTYGRVVPSGHLLFARAGVLMAVGLDLDRLELTGSPVPVLGDLLVSPSTGAAQFAVSETGTLVHTPAAAGARGSRNVWVDRTGKVEPASTSRADFLYSRLAPTGTALATVIPNDIWIDDLERDALRRLTFQAVNMIPVWSPDGTRIVFTSSRGGRAHLYWVPPDGGSEPSRLTTGDAPEFAGSISPNGTLLYSRAVLDPTRGPQHLDIWELRLGEPSSARLLIGGPFNQRTPAFSPDGKWVAYVSDESGQDEVFVQPYPPTGSKSQVSTNGGKQPLWAPNGTEIYYRDGSHVEAVAVSTVSAFRASRPVSLFEDHFLMTRLPPFPREYDVSADGKRFLMIEPADPQRFDRMRVTLNWFEALQATVPSAP